MKLSLLVTAAALALGAAQAYAQVDAQTDATSTATAQGDNAAMTNDAVGGQLPGMSASGAPHAKTRAEVYQDFLRAKQDGSLDRINALYGGGD